MGDINHDGYPEIVVAVEDAVYAYREDGVPVDGFPYSIPPGDPDESILFTPNIADIDGNGYQDIMLLTSNQRLLSFAPDGSQTRAFPKALPGSPKQTPMPFVYTADDSVAVAWIDEKDHSLRVFKLGDTASGDGFVWLGARGDASFSAALANSSIPANVTTTAPFEAYCYPNPITGGEGTFRFVPEAPTDCTIELYTADGLRVFEHHVPRSAITPGVPNEVRLDASRLASGLYIAKFTTRTRSVFYKVGVLK